jgi:hypothetical protein
MVQGVPYGASRHLGVGLYRATPRVPSLTLVGQSGYRNPPVGPAYELWARVQTVCKWCGMTYAECMYEACMMHAHDAFTHMEL